MNRLRGRRLVPLRRSDCPRVAQAILDNLAGHCKVSAGSYRGVTFVEFISPSYAVVIRGDDWSRIFPFIKYGSGFFHPVVPPDSPPPRIASPQPNRDMSPPPENPGQGLKSWLEHLDFYDYRKIQQLLTASRLDPSFGQSGGLVAKQRQVYLDPPEKSFDGLDSDTYNRLVNILQQLFPDDFPKPQR